MDVLFTPLAERHIQNLHTLITRASYENRADDYVQRIIDYCLSLATFPKRGTKRDDVLKGLRIIGFEHRVTIAFLVETDKVLIEGIYYGGQNWESDF